MACRRVQPPPGPALHNGEIVELELAERGTRLTNDLGVREVRRLSSSGAQRSILSTDMRLDLSRIAAEIAARWSQENSLKYSTYSVNTLGLNA